MTAVLRPGQRDVLRHLVAGKTNAEIAHAMGFTPQRAAAIIAALAAKGYVITPAPTNSKLIYPQDSRSHPVPSAGRWCCLFTNTVNPVIIRSVLLPRKDGLELPYGLPEERSVVIDVATTDYLSFVAPRMRRWSIQSTNRIIDITTLNVGYPTFSVLSELTLGLAWSLEAEAIIYDPDELTNDTIH